MEDGRIIQLFFERSDDAIHELSKKYGGICLNVAKNILNNYEDAEECVNDAYLGVWNTIPPETPKYLLGFVCRIVRNISINRYKHNRAVKRKGNYDLCVEEWKDYIASGKTIEDEVSEEELSAYIDEFLDSLSKTNRMIFVRRFWYLDSYEDIARVSGLNEGAVRTRLSRTKAGLKKYLEKKGVVI